MRPEEEEKEEAPLLAPRTVTVLIGENMPSKASTIGTLLLPRVLLYRVLFPPTDADDAAAAGEIAPPLPPSPPVAVVVVPRLAMHGGKAITSSSSSVNA
jgi:hypothetical protein